MSTKTKVARRAFSLMIMGGALVDLEVGHLFHGDLGAGGGGDEHPAQGRQVLPVILEVTQVHRVALQALHRLGEVHRPPGR